MKKFRLQTSLAASNYVLFSADAKLARYASEVAILEEFFTQRENLYKLRKQYLLARLRKDYEILVNKVKFIQAVIAEELKINRVKRKVLIKSLVEFGLKPMSQLNDIMAAFAAIGPTAHVKPIKAAADAGGDEPSGDLPAIEEEVEEGEVHPREFEYLLGMPMWSVTEERVEQLIRLMNEKQQEHAALQQKHEHDLWREDLDAFAAELERVWAKEEEERLKHGGVKNDGKKGKRRAPAKKGKAAIKDKPQREPENEPMGANMGKKKGKQARPMAAQESTMRPKAPEELTLRERMEARFGKDLPGQTSLFSGR